MTSKMLLKINSLSLRADYLTIRSAPCPTAIQKRAADN